MIHVILLSHRILQGILFRNFCCSDVSNYFQIVIPCSNIMRFLVHEFRCCRLEACSKELSNLLLEERLAGATLLVFANKQDLPGALEPKEIREVLELDNIKTHHWIILGCSAVTGENLLSGMDWLIEDIASRIFTVD